MSGHEDDRTPLEMQTGRRRAIRSQLAAFVRKLAADRGHGQGDLERAYWPSTRPIGQLWRIAFMEHATSEDAIFALMAMHYRVAVSVVPQDEGAGGPGDRAGRTGGEPAILEFEPRDETGLDLLGHARPHPGANPGRR